MNAFEKTVISNHGALVKQEISKLVKKDEAFNCRSLQKKVKALKHLSDNTRYNYLTIICRWLASNKLIVKQGLYYRRVK